MSVTTFLWHDYETFGSQTRQDWPAQFAGIRTDADLNEIGDPMVWYCQPPLDRLPNPESCLITGITPQKSLDQGLPEYRFADAINTALSTPGTIGVGYNSIRFDDEVTRFLLWRNLIDPYAREWQNNCSRWDLFNVVLCAYALRPNGIEWPLNDDGQPSFKLEKLSAANHLIHLQAHDALADTRASLALARLIRNQQPKLFDFCLSLRNKDRVAQELGLPITPNLRPFLHISSKFSAARGCLAVMAPLAMHPYNKNELLAWDLAADPSELIVLTADEVRERLFTATSDLPKDVVRLPIKGVHLNKSPIVIRNLKTLIPERAERWGVDWNVVERNLKRLRQLPDLGSLWRAVYSRPEKSSLTDVDEDLYSGFLSASDRHHLDRLRTLPPQELVGLSPSFDDKRLPELLFRYRARNFPETLNAVESKRWHQYCQERLRNSPNRMDTLQPLAQDQHSQLVLEALYQWEQQLMLDT
ncbi:exonuclease I [Candidatus Nitrosoglobus terrae]|uniref:Exodeoxyribonuclease I n=1 Tax=Candidatus Nitrosoglobus terrae TaxID=1630141 RepID=A0A1Q2SLW7_9GAMM|nr:exodeoxyribonuclease I [Candidatus Nitrosoglobus terrae]BAW80136.1 exonuclease I [Candidatus Nitrosoglobus terrae]